MAQRTKKRYVSVPVTQVLRQTRTASETAVEHLNTQLFEAYNRISLDEKELSLRRNVFDKYKRLFEDQIECEVKPFGSFYTTLCVRDSDIDMTIVVDVSSSNIPASIASDHTPSASSPATAFSSRKATDPVYSDSKPVANFVLRKVVQLIEKSNMVEGSVIHVRKARTPILKFIDKESGCKMDVSVNKIDGIQTAEYIRGVLKEVPSLRYMAVILKYFLKIRRLGDASTGGLCSYAQFLLLLSFLKIHPLVQGGNIDVKKNLGVLFVDFFQFYGIDFPYDRTCISIRELKYRPSTSKGIDVADPIIPGNNVASGCTMIGFIRDVFRYSYRIMSTALKNSKSAKVRVVDMWLRFD